MRRLLCIAIFVAAWVIAPAAQDDALTDQQRIADLNQLAAMYAKYYAPYEWKRDVVGFDLLRMTPWVQRIRHSDDLDFQEALIEYVASLNDAHDFVSFPSNFSATSGITTDIYDGKVLIDSINRSLLPVAQFPFGVGDEIVAVDGVGIQDVIASLRKYLMLANPRSTDRYTSYYVLNRFQQIMPHAADIGDSAAVTVKFAATGITRTYDVPWRKAGVPILSQGPVPSPRRGNGVISPSSGGAGDTTGAGAPMLAGFHANANGVEDDSLPPYMQPLRALLNGTLPAKPLGVLNFGSKTPMYAAPAGFVQRLGASASHFFLTGTFPANGLRIGLIRIPNMTPSSTSAALSQLNTEIAFMNANTDALIVDVTRNTGGSINYTESIAQRLFPTSFRTVGFEIRATAYWIASFDASVVLAEQSGAPASVVTNLRNNRDEIIAAFNENRGRTVPISLNPSGNLTLDPATVAYSKPLMVLIDEFSASAAEMFASIIQDNHRGLLFGMRTMGAGGSVVSFDGTAYSEATTSITLSLANRGRVITTPDYVPAPYIENIGVRPDITADIMTRTNLMTGGVPFTQAFVNAIVQYATPH
jgi:C-terminal processing protease CtpA/Prc